MNLSAKYSNDLLCPEQPHCLAVFVCAVIKLALVLCVWLTVCVRSMKVPIVNLTRQMVVVCVCKMVLMHCVCHNVRGRLLGSVCYLYYEVSQLKKTTLPSFIFHMLHHTHSHTSQSCKHREYANRLKSTSRSRCASTITKPHLSGVLCRPDIDRDTKWNHFAPPPPRQNNRHHIFIYIENIALYYCWWQGVSGAVVDGACLFWVAGFRPGTVGSGYMLRCAVNCLHYSDHTLLFRNLLGWVRSTVYMAIYQIKCPIKLPNLKWL